MRVLALTVLLAGCAVQPAQVAQAPSAVPVSVIVKHDFCDEAKPIYLTLKDHVDKRTRDMILDHNRRGVALCGWKP